MRTTATRGDTWTTRVTVAAAGLDGATYTADLRRTATSDPVGPVTATVAAAGVIDLTLAPEVTALLPPRSVLRVRATTPGGRVVTVLTVELFADDAA